MNEPKTKATETLYVLYKSGKEVKIQVKEGTVMKIIDARNQSITTNVTWRDRDVCGRPYLLEIGHSSEAVTICALPPIDYATPNKS